jgi:hypothetical protein
VLEAWLDQIARELMPKAPPTALALFQAFIEADAVFFECADDSDARSAMPFAQAAGTGCRPLPDARHLQANGRAGSST